MTLNKPAGTAAPAAPGREKALLSDAVRFLQAGMAGQARRLCLEVLQLAPGDAQALFMLGMIAAMAGEYAQAVDWLGQSLQNQPANPAALNNRGIAFKQLGRLQEAEDSLRAALALKPDYVEALNNLGNVLRALGRSAEALAEYERALALRPNMAEAHNNRGSALLDLKQPDQALESFRKAIALKQNYVEAHSNKASALVALRQPERALALADRAIALQRDHVEAWMHRGIALTQLRRYADALQSYDQAIALQPGHALAHANRGAALLELNRHEDALASFDRALAIDPGNADFLENRAQAAAGAKRQAEAAADYERLLAQDPDRPWALGNLLHARMLCADWTGYETLRADIDAALAQGLPAAEPFGYQGVAASEPLLRRCTESYAATEFPPASELPVGPPVVRQDNRITIGYLCGEFRQHATTILMAGVYEHHDRGRFRLIAFDNGGADGSDYRRRVEAAFDEVIDIRGVSDADAAALVRDKGVDVLVNLNGYYGEGRMGVFAHRPSPVQVNYLGFPGTLGASYIDYLIADAVVIPPESRAHYTEKVVWLPDCYQANDPQRRIAGDAPTRAQAGLPADAFVYCCFNNNYKITPATFDAWVRILQRVPGSVLWLLEDNAVASANLRAAAQARGLDPARLVFAPRQPLEQHLARHALADLFLDTLPYNAHTTASDALWAGLPILTQTGTTFAGRVTTSLLKALDLPELITDTAAAYEDLAVQLAQDRAQLRALRDKLGQHRRQAPLFDCARFTRHLEAAFERMVQRQRAGLIPAALDLRVINET